MKNRLKVLRAELVEAPPLTDDVEERSEPLNFGAAYGESASALALADSRLAAFSTTLNASDLEMDLRRAEMRGGLAVTLNASSGTLAVPLAGLSGGAGISLNASDRNGCVSSTRSALLSTICSGTRSAPISVRTSRTATMWASASGWRPSTLFAGGPACCSTARRCACAGVVCGSWCGEYDVG